ncbi:MAG: SMC-Scp complex subunit ScpB [Spartobacteria bacterium]|nr:SMC-Scp complex subunit ScpB [Spartobacteria bacterium]
MSKVDVLPEVKEIVGALLFAAKNPVSPAQIRKVLKQVGEDRGGAYADFGTLKESEITAAVEGLGEELAQRGLGLSIAQVAGGYRLENDVRCGPWIRQLLERGKPQRLSRPALETLAIIAYRQPSVRSEIEAVRGVACDQVLRNLMELQLVRIVGRSELPGRPMLFGTTQKFLEYFGIRHLDDLPGVSELARMNQEDKKTGATAKKKNEEGPEAVQGELLPREDGDSGASALEEPEEDVFDDESDFDDPADAEGKIVDEETAEDEDDEDFDDEDEEDEDFDDEDEDEEEEDFEDDDEDDDDEDEDDEDDIP